jgi:predicted negative regulator of RcsB-dependent stress response
MSILSHSFVSFSTINHIKFQTTHLTARSTVTMSGNKAALKAAKVALDAENYDDAVTQCQIVLASDSQNYFAYVAS